MLCIVGLLYLTFYGHFTTSLASFMPPGKTPAERLMLTQMQHAPATREILIGIAGGTLAQRATASKAYAAKLKASQLFSHVSNGSFRLPDTKSRLFAWRYLLSPAITPAHFTIKGLHSALEKQLKALNSPLSMLSQRYLAADPTGSFLALLESWKPATSPDKHEGVWFSPDAKLALLLAQTRAPGLNLDAMQRVITTLHDSFLALPGSQDLHLILSGTPVIAIHSKNTIKSDTQIFTTAASLLLSLLLLVAYRSLRLLILAALPLLSAVLAGALMVNLGFGEIQGITLAFGSTLLGVAVDYPMHLFSHLDAAIPARHSLMRIWPTLRLGVLTTAAGYVGLLGTQFPGLIQLGVFAITGLLAAAAVTRWVLPQLLPPNYSPSLYLSWLLRLSEAIRRIPVRAKMIISLLAVCFSVTSLWWHRHPFWENNLAALSPVSAASLATDQRLRADLHAPDVGQLIVVQAKTAQTALLRSQRLAGKLNRLQTKGWFSGAQMAVQYLSDLQIQRKRQQTIPPAPVLAHNLQQALQGLPFRSGVFRPFLVAAEVARHQSLVTPADVQGTLIGPLVNNLLYEQGHQWYALIPLIGVKAPQRLAHWFASHPMSGVTYLDTHAESARLMHSFRNQTLDQLGLVLGAIVLVLFFGLRHPREITRVIVPLVLAELIDVAILIAIGEELTLFHLIAMLMVAGISIDYALFFSHPEADPVHRRRTLHALTLCAASTVSVFAILAISPLPILRALGLTAAIGVGTAYLLAMILAQRNVQPINGQIAAR